MTRIAFCRQSFTYYTHSLTWVESTEHKLYQMKNVDNKSCVCKAYEKGIKRHILGMDYQLDRRDRKVKNHGTFIIPACKVTSTDAIIIHTGLVTKRGQITSPNKTHYRHIHCLLQLMITCMTAYSVFRCNTSSKCQANNVLTQHLLRISLVHRMVI